MVDMHHVDSMIVIVIMIADKTGLNHDNKAALCKAWNLFLVCLYRHPKKTMVKNNQNLPMVNMELYFHNNS